MTTAKVLFINACIRGKNSRTQMIATEFIEALKNNASILIEEVNLPNLHPDYMLFDQYKRRKSLLEQNNLDDSFFTFAKQFQCADYIIVAAPYWDLCFPAVLKIYIENISVSGITFLDTPTGTVGNCKAKKMIYITTRGFILDDPNLEIGIHYFRSLCKVFGIPHFDSIKAEGLDLPNSNLATILENAFQEARNKAKSFIEGE